MALKSKAQVFDPGYTQTPGMDNAQRDADCMTWKTTVEDITGGHYEALGYCSGPQVGPPYDADALGEERAMITYPGKGKK
jgi:hypothetical protein